MKNATQPRLLCPNKACHNCCFLIDSSRCRDNHVLIQYLHLDTILMKQSVKRTENSSWLLSIYFFGTLIAVLFGLFKTFWQFLIVLYVFFIVFLKLLKIFFRYVTDILNMLQGFYIFIIFICKRNVIEASLKQLGKDKPSAGTTNIPLIPFKKKNPDIVSGFSGNSGPTYVTNVSKHSEGSSSYNQLAKAWFDINYANNKACFT